MQVSALGVRGLLLRLKIFSSKSTFLISYIVSSAGMDNPILYKDNVEVVLGNAYETCEALKYAL